jgi:hypothetical protein
MIILLPLPINLDGSILFCNRADGQMVLEAEVYSQPGSLSVVRSYEIELADGDYYLELPNRSGMYCVRIENQVAQVADFWPQLDMLRAMQAGKAYNWTNQANEVLRVAIEEAS